MSKKRIILAYLPKSKAFPFMNVLGIETSCDETGVAVFNAQRGLLAHALFSQVAIHAEYGGVVPELASRDHVRKLIPLIRQVMREAATTVCFFPLFFTLQITVLFLKLSVMIMIRLILLSSPSATLFLCVW